MTSTPEPPAPDGRLLDAHDLARAALREITPDATVGDIAGHTVQPDGVVSLRFHNRLPAYPGWFWTVSLAVVEDAEPTVLEVELLPGDGALLAPEWVPWAVRLADYQAAQAAQAESDEDDDEFDDEDGDAEDDGDDADLDDELDSDEFDDAEDFDDDGARVLHAGDVDGVDIDELDDAASDDDASDDDDDENVDDDDESDDVDGERGDAGAEAVDADSDERDADGA